MEWTDDAVILETRRHGETSLIVTALSREHGRYAGLVRGGAGKTKRGILQPGNHIRAQWRARLAEHLGSFTCELVSAHAGYAMTTPILLSALSSACSVAATTLPEREPHPAIYDGLVILLGALQGNDWPSVYVKWELGLLGELGFGLDLSECAATGSPDDLSHVSPKSGRAVSREAAEPYKERLLSLPGFLLNGGGGEPDDVLEGLKLTGFFLTRHVYGDNGQAQPDARARFVQSLRNQAGQTG